MLTVLVATGALYLAVTALVFQLVVEQSSRVSSTAIETLSGVGGQIGDLAGKPTVRQFLFNAASVPGYSEQDYIDFLSFVGRTSYHPKTFDDKKYVELFGDSSKALVGHLNQAKVTALNQGQALVANAINDCQMVIGPQMETLRLRVNLYIDTLSSWRCLKGDLIRGPIIAIPVVIASLAIIVASFTNHPSIGNHPSLNLFSAITLSTAVAVGVSRFGLKVGCIASIF